MKIKKNSSITNFIILILFLISLLGYQVKAQETPPEQIFVNTSLIHLLTKIAEKESKDNNELESRKKEKKQAQEELEKTQRDLSIAQKVLEVRKTEENIAKLNLKAAYHPSGGMKSIDERKIEAATLKLESAVSKRTDAETEVNLLRERAQNQNQRITDQENLISAVEKRIASEQLKRTQQKNSLEASAKQWRSNPSDENLALLAEQITIVAKEQDANAKIIWKSTPRQGVLVYYQTKRGRERGDIPTTSSNTTDTKENEKEDVPIGQYYVWSEEGGRPISDKDRLVYIEITTPSVTIKIDR